MYHRLEAGHTVTLVNPQHLKAVPGHQTDVQDSEWLADLLRHGLLKACSRPAQGLLKACSRPAQGLLKAGSRPAQGLLKACCIPPRPIRELRELTR